MNSVYPTLSWILPTFQAIDAFLLVFCAQAACGCTQLLRAARLAVAAENLQACAHAVPAQCKACAHPPLKKPHLLDIARNLYLPGAQTPTTLELPCPAYKGALAAAFSASCPDSAGAATNSHNSRMLS